MSSTARFRPKFCKMGYHLLEGAKSRGVHPVDMTMEKDGRAIKVPGELTYTLLECVCGEVFATGFEGRSRS